MSKKFSPLCHHLRRWRMLAFFMGLKIAIVPTSTPLIGPSWLGVLRGFMTRWMVSSLHTAQTRWPTRLLHFLWRSDADSRSPLFSPVHSYHSLLMVQMQSLIS